MEVENGIIIDGVLHEGIENESWPCKECSMNALCNEYSVPLCTMTGCGGFVNRGKVKVEKEETQCP